MSLPKRLPLALVAFVACTPYRLPFTQPPGPAERPDPHQASVVFLWPVTSCDPAGYLTLATTDGRFLGNISRGSRLEVAIPAGESTLVAWNGVMEAATGWMSAATVPVLHADLREGRTYYVRILFGEWDARGPTEGVHDQTRVVRARSSLRSRRCTAVPWSTTGAMVALSPTLEGWNEIPEWMEELDATLPDRAAGQAWLDGDRALVETHGAVGEERFARLRPEAKRLATLEPFDGAPR